MVIYQRIKMGGDGIRLTDETLQQKRLKKIQEQEDIARVQMEQMKDKYGFSVQKKKTSMDSRIL